MLFESMRFETLLVLCAMVTGIVTLCNYIYFKSKGVKVPEVSHKYFWAVDYCRSFFPVFLLVLVLRSFLFEAFRIPSGSMKPTLIEGDFIVVNKFDYGFRLPVLGTKVIPMKNPKTGDIIVFKHESGKDLIKRVVGVPGDHIRYANKKLYINGHEVPTKDVPVTAEQQPVHPRYTLVEKEEQLNNLSHNIYIYPEHPALYAFSDVIVPENSYFVMGDNRDNSEDSRFWGFVRDEDILGRGVLTWLSMDGWNLSKVRWDRFGKSMYNYTDKDTVKDSGNEKS